MGSLAPNYAPLDVTLSRGNGAWLTDVTGKRYLDFLAGYSAVNFGHCHPMLTAAVHEQLDTLTLVSRAFKHDLLEPFADALTSLTGTEMMLPMNTGAEAVETAIKAARRWAYLEKGIPEGSADIIVAANSFHGRTTTIVSFSTDPDAHDHYGPHTPGFRIVPYDDAEAVADAITPHTAAILVEPIQGEGGVIIPSPHFLPRLRSLADEHNILLILDEVQAGLGRTGHTLDQQRVGVAGDLTTLGKALGGGILPVSAVTGRADVLGVFTPGTHGSTFGGNPLACRVGIAVVHLLETGEFQARAGELGQPLGERLSALHERGLIAGFRNVGLWAGVDIDPARGTTAKEVCLGLRDRGVLAKDTHGNTIRLAPPLVITEAELHTAMDAFEETLINVR